MLDQVNQTTAAIIGVVTAVTLLAGAYKVLWYGKRDRNGQRTPGLIRRVLLDLRALRDAVLGREPVVDSITGKELAPPLPGIGQRMANTETQMSILTDAVAKLADSHRRLDDLDERVTALEQQKVERVIGKAEQVQMLRTMEAVAKADPSQYEDDDPQRLP